MATIQKMSSIGHRIYWRLYFPDATNKEKYKASKSKTILKEILPDVMKIETLSRRNELTRQDLMRAINLGIVTRDEARLFFDQVGPIEDHFLSELRMDYETQSKAQSPSMHSHMANLYKGDVLEDHFKEIPVAKITPEIIETYRADRKRTVTPSTINQDLKALRKYLDIAVSKKWIKENPARSLKLLREPKSRIPRCLYPDEIKLYFEGMKKYRHWLHGDFEFIIQILIYTGLRRSELCSLRPENIKLHLRQIHLMGKGQKHRIVGIHKSLMNDLQRRVKRGYILDPVTRPESISRAFKMVSRALGLSESLTLHSLRHTYISYLLEKGVPTKLVKERAGHFSLAITDRYTHAIPTDRIEEDILDFGHKDR
jgi:site-specific recombinase XerD